MKAAALFTAALILAVVALSGCCSKRVIEWVPEGDPMTLSEAEKLARTADISFAGDIEVETAPEARRDALVWLRQQGPDGDRAATLLTQGFPERTASVPVHVEITSVEGTRSLVVVEAYGGPTGKLDRRRLWVFAFESGQMIRSAAFQ